MESIPRKQWKNSAFRDPGQQKGRNGDGRNGDGGNQPYGPTELIPSVPFGPTARAKPISPIMNLAPFFPSSCDPTKPPALRYSPHESTPPTRSEEHTPELQLTIRISDAAISLKQKTTS